MIAAFLSTIEDEAIIESMNAILDGAIMGMAPQHPVSSLRAAAEALDGQTIVVKSGTHSLVCDVSSPTLVDRRLQIIGEPGAVLYGGLQFGKHSWGRMNGIEIRGHLWIYGGEWEVHGCKIRNILIVGSRIMVR